MVLVRGHTLWRKGAGVTFPPGTGCLHLRQHHLALGPVGLQGAASQDRNRVLAAVVLDHALHRFGHHGLADDVEGQDIGQGVLVFRLHQRVNGACEQFRKGVIGGSKSGEGPASGGFRQDPWLERGPQSLV